MNYTVWKQSLSQDVTQDVEMPDGAEILHVARQRNSVCLWFRCNPDNPMTKRTIQVLGTGHPSPAPGYSKYLGTVFFGDGALIFHVFELLRRMDAPAHG